MQIITDQIKTETGKVVKVTDISVNNAKACRSVKNDNMYFDYDKEDKLVGITIITVR